MINKVKKTKKNETAKQAIIRELKSNLPSNAAEKMSGEFIGKFDKRASGYLRIIKMLPRKSDGARRAVIEFV